MENINQLAEEMLSQANLLDSSRLPEKISLYERGLALYPTNQEVAGRLLLGLARVFLDGKAYRLAKHRMLEAVKSYPQLTEELPEIISELNAIDFSTAPDYPEEFARTGEAEFRKITYSVEQVWKLDVPVQTIPITDIESHLAMRYWATHGFHHNLTPLEVIANPEFHKHEFDRIMAADLSHPIDICEWRGNKMMVDGLHRLAKSKTIGAAELKVRFIPFGLLRSIGTVFEE